MSNQPGEGYLGEQNNLVHNPPGNNPIYITDEFIHSLYSNAVDSSWEVFRYFTRVHMWDGFVYLFILVWNSEPGDIYLEGELSLIEGHLSRLKSIVPESSEEKVIMVDEIMTQFKQCRITKDEVMRNDLMSKVYYQLSSQNVFQPHLSNLIHLLNSMTTLQKQVLRHTFISRIYGYLLFAEYLSGEWRPTDETNEDDKLLIKGQTQKIETGLRQILAIPNLSNQNEKSVENNITDKAREFLNILNNEVPNKNSENVNLVPDSKIEKEPEIKKKEEKSSVNIEKESADEKMEITNNDETKEKEESSSVKIEKESADKKMEITNGETKKKEESSEFVDDENLSDKKEVKNIKEGNIKINANVTSKITSKEKVKNDGRRVEYKNKRNSRARNPSVKGGNSSPKGESSSVKAENSSIEVENPSIKIVKLQREVEALRQEAAKHQAALGEITNVGWRDDDSNNSMQLTKDIEKLQKDLADFTRVKGKGVVINDEADKLLQNLKCKTLIENNAKLVISAALQQKLIDFTLTTADKWFKQTLDEITDDKLEIAILSSTNELIELTNRFTKFNTETDKHTQLLPIKIRQHIYAALGQHSFINSDHPFIKHLVDKNLSSMDKYRTINDDARNKKIKSEAATIFRQILHLFYFRLHTQEPRPSIKFYESGEEFDPGVMEPVGQMRNDDGEDNEELEVEICSFPAVALLENLNDEEERRVFTKAQVIVRPKNSA